MTSTEKAVETRRFIVPGRVQGVGFRWFVEREAHMLGIAGWVRNNRDGERRSAGAGNARAARRLCGRAARGPARRAGRCSRRIRRRADCGNLNHSALKEPGRCRRPSAQHCEPSLKKLIREVPDFPKPGILFYDITTLLKDKARLRPLIDALTEHYIDQDIDLVLGMEARGFIFAPALAYRLNAGFIPVRKPKKLPAEVVQWNYELEYGTNTLEIHKDAIQPGQRVIIVRRSAGHRRHRGSHGQAGRLAGRATSAAWDLWSNWTS